MSKSIVNLNFSTVGPLFIFCYGNYAGETTLSKNAGREMEKYQFLLVELRRKDNLKKNAGREMEKYRQSNTGGGPLLTCNFVRRFLVLCLEAQDFPLNNTFCKKLQKIAVFIHFEARVTNYTLQKR